ncbi:MAG: glycosyltransferase family 9 protein, partial [Deltaproteobacteria bacterium]
MKILVIQTAFIGDVILATALLEKLHRRLPHARIDVVVRKGNEALFSGHPYVQKVHVWNKKQDKTLNLLKLGIRLRRERYDWVINLQRFFSTGLLTLMSLAPNRAGFYKNPLSGWFTHPAPHRIGTPEAPVHEVERNCLLADPLAGPGVFRP